MTPSRIADSLAGLVEPVGKVKPHPENPRKGNVEGIASSLERFGQVRPILVQASTGFIVAGNHTYQAARSLGWRQIAVARVEMTDVEARAYMLADNRWSDVAENDDVALEAILRGLEDAGELAGTGYQPGDADDLRELINQLPDAAPPEEPPPGAAAADGRPGRVRGATVDITMTMPADAKPAFSADLDRLRAQWGTKGLTETVLRAVAECLERLA
jgi:ParB-like chromosome segregation protein Spo0J